MPFGEIVIGSPGSGKSTYAYGKYQLLTALKRTCVVVNLDPANDPAPYPSPISLSSIITLRSAMSELGLGPNGGMLYCIEYLEQNFDWLQESIEKECSDARERGEEEPWFIFDCPGQVELSTNHDSLKKIVDLLQKGGFRLAAVHLCDAHYVTDASKYVSVLLLSLRTMLHLGLPHINVLSKVDLITKYGDLDFNLDFYTEVQDLSYLSNLLQSTSPRFTALNIAICDLIEDFGYVSFETLAVEDKKSMLNLTHVVDRALGYVFTPAAPLSASAASDPASTTPGKRTPKTPNAAALFTSAAGAFPDAPKVQDVQERWVEAREEWDAWEKNQWRGEAERSGS